MASKGQLTGMAGVYFAAAELSKIGFIVTPTSRNAQGIDLLIANNDGTKTCSAQVNSLGFVGHFEWDQTVILAGIGQ